MTDEKPLSITYFFGQIKPEFRGDLALFVELLEGEKDPAFTQMPLERVTKHSEGVYSPIRAYIGVNKEATAAVSARYYKGNCNAFTLDHQIVREDIVKRRYDEVQDVIHSNLQAMINDGR
jgi:hypothetical protein